MGTAKIMAVLVVGGLATACGSSSSGSTTATTAPASSTTAATPFHAAPGDAVAVWGTGTCDFSGEGVNPEGGSGWLVECDLDMSDPRVSGTETQDRIRFLVGRVGAGDVWAAEEANITNAEGSWRGSAQGAEDPAAFPIGEAHYVGEGAYEGLEFHYYFFDHGDPQDCDCTRPELHGWISGGG